MQSPYSSWWFLLFVLGLILFLIGFFAYAFRSNLTSVDTWIWVLLIIGFVLTAIAVIYYIIASTRKGTIETINTTTIETVTAPSVTTTRSRVRSVSPTPMDE